MPVFLLLLLFPTFAFAWTLTDRCELTRETPKGTVAVSPITNGILLYLPDGLVANDTWIKVGIGSRSWRVRVVGGAVALKGGAKPFLEKNWMTVHVDGDSVLGFSLVGSSAAWEKLQDCEMAAGSGGWLTLIGKITASTDDEIISDIRRERPAGLVLSSDGGLGEEAQRIGYAIRDARIATKVEADGQCLSECVFILAAGAPRTVEVGARVGMHPSLVTMGLGVLDEARRSVTDSAVYFNRMGVQGGRLAVLATGVTNGDIRLFTPEELRSIGLVETKVHAAAPQAVIGGSSEWNGDGWWWVLVLLGLGVVFSGIAKIWNRE